ncbi:MAG: hypothetical protein J6U00_09280 [Ruminococcus sp.]|uniref:hypothetical protein n=1 Tax=Ruminococcus sp. TaxID=41978 RepID=UPI001B14541B|nr:hypothetical protein [Ruminococcus sp.]MBO7474174.1 hypothetical protein [Ruminococcus sp.]MBP5433261.1 hypothetical protein [Ruminococcus sp.]
MNNIIKSQMFIMKHKAVSLTAAFVSALLAMSCGFLLNQNSAEAFSQPGLMALFIVLFIPVIVLCYSYSERIQMYEIMAGFRPHKIILGKVITFTPVLLLYLAVTIIISMMSDSSPQTVTRLIIYCILCIRGMLCIVFLSPLFKLGSFAPLFSVMLLTINGSDMEALSHSPVSFFGFGQCALLVRDITDSFMIKVIVSAVVSCAIYYLIGYFTLKKKIALEPHQLT